MKPKYKNYTVADFASERSFINYCLNYNKQDVEFWENWLLDNPDRTAELAKAKEVVLQFSLGLNEEELIAERERFISQLDKEIEN